VLHFLLDYVYLQAQNRTYNWILKFWQVAPESTFLSSADQFEKL
jgi:hypothetical protein